MPSTASTRNRFEKQAAGENSNTWGTKLNAVIDRVDESLDGVTAFTLSGSKTLTDEDYDTDESRKRVLNITGGTGGTVTIPNVEKVYLVRNGSGGSVIITTGSGTTATIPTLISTWVFCNGSNAVYAIDMTDLWTYRRLSSNFTHATSVVAETGLYVGNAEVTADHEYEFEATLYAKISTGGALFHLVWMGGLTDGVAETRAVLSTSQVVAAGSPSSGASYATASATLGTAYRPVFLKGHFIPSSSKSGNLMISVAAASGTPTITIRAGSFIKFRRSYP